LYQIQKNGFGVLNIKAEGVSEIFERC